MSDIVKIGSNDEKIYEGGIDLSNKNNSHTIMFDFIQGSRPKRGARILETGCATGFFGSFLKDHGYEVWGVEMSPFQAEIATKRLDYVYVGSIEDFLKSEPLDGIFFDYIIFGDVLEHLKDPLEVLKSSAHILSSHGAILTSIPNVAHLAVRLMLLEGRWEYSPFGILDDSHLRFFTRRSIVELFTNAGYSIASMYAVRVPIEVTGIEVNQVLLEAASELITDDDQEVYQFVVMATKRPEMSSTKNNTRFVTTKASRILCLLPIEDWSLGNIRIRNPLETWRQIYAGEVRIKSIYEHTPEDLSWADFIILQRESNMFTLELMAKLQGLGKAIIFDIDDLLTDVPSFLSSHSAAIKWKKDLEEALRSADAVTVTTPRLQHKIETYNENVYIVPNCASSNNVPAQHYSTEDALVRLIVASSDTVRVDFIAESLSRLQADPEVNLKILGIGPPGKYLLDSGLDIECYDNMDYERFKAFLSSIDNAIGVIPLDDSEFSACKSAIKYVDYSLAGIPVVCSAVRPYSDVIQDGATGILADNNEEAWFRVIKRLALSITERQRLSASAMEYCLDQYSMKRAAEIWDNVFSDVKPGRGKIIDKRELKPRISFRAVSFVLRRCLKPASYMSLFRVVLSEVRTCIKNIYARICAGLYYEKDI